MDNEAIAPYRTNGGCLLAAAAVLFWFSWLMMPGVGVTDPREIFQLVGSQRTGVMLSVLVQLTSAVLYVPAVLAIVTDLRLREIPGLRLWAGILVVGAMGSAADAVLHLLAYAMTSPGLETESLVPVMAFMQGPGLFILAPMIICFFAGGVGLAVAFSRVGKVPASNVWLHIAALGIAAVGGSLASEGFLSSRLVGLTALGAVSLAQVWFGMAAASNRTRGLPHDLILNTKGEQL